MSSSLELLDRLRRFNADVRNRDTDLGEESLELGRAEVSEAVMPGRSAEDEVELESIVMRTSARSLRSGTTMPSRLPQRGRQQDLESERLEAQGQSCTTSRFARSAASSSRAASTNGSEPAGSSARHPRHEPPRGERIRRCATARASYSRRASASMIGASVDFPPGDRQSQEARVQARPAAHHRGARRDPTSRFSRSRGRRATARSQSRSRSRQADRNTGTSRRSAIRPTIAASRT